DAHRWPGVLRSLDVADARAAHRADEAAAAACYVGGAMNGNRERGTENRVIPRGHGITWALGMTAIASSALFAQAQSGTYGIRGVTVVAVVGAQIPNGTVVIAGGKIQAVGANVQAPQGATIIDATGLFVYPGMIDSGTELGLTEIGSVPGSTDTREI